MKDYYKIKKLLSKGNVYKMLEDEEVSILRRLSESPEALSAFLADTDYKISPFFTDAFKKLQDTVKELTLRNKEIRAHNDGLDQQLNKVCIELDEANKTLEKTSRELIIKAQIECEHAQACNDRKYLAEENKKIKRLLADMLKVLEEANPPIAEFVEYNAKCACYLGEETND